MKRSEQYFSFTSKYMIDSNGLASVFEQLVCLNDVIIRAEDRFLHQTIHWLSFESIA